MSKKSVLSIGWDPDVADLSAFPDLTPAKVRAGLNAAKERLEELGYSTQLCLLTSGDTAAAEVLGLLKAKTYDCVIIGAGVRVEPKHVLLFEKLVNVIHEQAPQAKLCFNTRPTDTVEAVQRWI